jgi:5-methylcytosine-specific restriction protein A
LDGRRLSEQSVAHLRCDESVRALVTDAEGVPLWLGRSTRFPTPTQRVAIGVRDGGCTFPGCDAAMSWADVHHEPAWEEGGRTDLDVLVALCRRHHRLVHSPGWSLSIDDTQRVAFASPSGRRFRGQRHGRIHTGADPPRRE